MLLFSAESNAILTDVWRVGDGEKGVEVEVEVDKAVAENAPEGE